MVQSFNLEENMTDDALIDASMSMLDVTGTNATLVFQVTGLEIENLAGVSAGAFDIAAEGIVEWVREQKERNDNDGKDAAIAVMEEIQERELERISRIPPQFDLTAEEWENVAENLKDPGVRQAITDTLIKNGATDAEAQQTILYMEAMARVAAAEDAHVEPAASDLAIIDRYENDPAMNARVNDVLPMATSNAPRLQISTEDKVSAFEDMAVSNDDVVDYQAFLDAGSAQPAFTMAAEGNVPINEQELEIPQEQPAIASAPGFEFSLG